MVTLVIVFIAGGLYLAYFVALSFGFRKATARTGRMPVREDIHFSVVVAARNEADRIPNLLRALKGQSHPRFECVIVDDASDDATADIVKSFADTDARFRIERPAATGFPRKKNALAHGIASARSGRLAFTDADCTPGPQWLETLSRYCTGPDAIVVGFSPFTRRPSVLNRVARYETFVTAFLTAGAIGRGRPYMAVGRNLSYHRDIFEQIGGFAHSHASLSGDDDLLVQETVRKGIGRVAYMADPEGFVVSEAAESWRSWLRQKMRHASAGRFYATGTKLHLGLFHVSNLVLWSSPLWLGWTGAAVLALKWAAQGSLMFRPAVQLRQQDLLAFLPALDLAYLLYNTFVAAAGVLTRPQRW